MIKKIINDWLHRNDGLYEFVPVYRFCGTQTAVAEFLHSKESIEEAIGAPVIMVDCLDTMHGMLVRYRKIEPAQSTGS